MKNSHLLTLLFALFIVSVGQGQTARDTLSGHDVIVLQDGKILRGKVLEIGLESLHYKRAGYLNGPAYTVALETVYAVNYPNGKSDYFADNAPNGRQQKKKKKNKDKKNALFKTAAMSLGVGFLKQQSRGDDILEQAQQTNNAPAITLRYTTRWRNKLALGIEAGAMGYRFSGDQAETYDNAIVSGQITENVLSLTLFAQYSLTKGRFMPYALGGAGLVTSAIDSELTVIPLDTGVNYQLNSGARDTRLGLMLRAGLQYRINELLVAYADAGAGLTLLQGGITLTLR